MIDYESMTNYEFIRDTYKENDLLNDLRHINYVEGLHHGRWEDESAMDESADEYLKEMKRVADKYCIEYINDLDAYIEDLEYESECYTKDRMASELRELIECELLKRIVYGEDDYI